MTSETTATASAPTETATPPPLREWTTRAFSARQLRTIRRVAEAMFDPDGRPDAARRIDWTLDDVDQFAGRAGASTRVALSATLAALQFMPALFGFGLRRMGSLPLEARTRYLERLEQSAIPYVGVPLFAWKSILSLSYFEHPEALAATGYDGECLLGTGSLVRGDRKPSRAKRAT